MATNALDKRHPNFKDLTGQVFGTLTVLRSVPAPEGKPKLAYWLCQCTCGEERVVTGKSLRQGNTTRCKSCHSRKHGMYKSPEYTTWAGVMHRCKNSMYAQWELYGGRGIRVCERWSNSFEAFFDDMGPRPSSKHSIDRIDNDGHYSCGTCPDCIQHGWPANCRWGTLHQQNRNKSTTHNITHNGITMCLADWAAHTGISITGLRKRLNDGWSVTKALTTPVAYRSPVTSHASLTHNGITQSLRQWGECLGISYHTLLCRIRSGWPIDRVLSERIHR